MVNYALNNNLPWSLVGQYISGVINKIAMYLNYYLRHYFLPQMVHFFVTGFKNARMKM